MNEQACDPSIGPILSSQWINKTECMEALRPASSPNTRDHQFTVDACGGDAELICVLQKAMERFTTPILNSKEYIDPLPFGPVNAEAVAEWFYAKYGPKG